MRKIIFIAVLLSFYSLVFSQKQELLPSNTTRSEKHINSNSQRLSQIPTYQLIEFAKAQQGIITITEQDTIIATHSWKVVRGISNNNLSNNKIKNQSLLLNPQIARIKNDSIRY